MAKRDLIVIGASAGGIEALKEVARALPANLPAAVLVAIHLPAAATSVLPAILTRAGKLPAAHPADGEALAPGRIYVAPPDHHLLVHQDTVRLSRGPRVNGYRPAIDPLFMTAARWYGARAISVVLSGVLDDGTAGTAMVRRAGGATVAQSPETALYPQMPSNAIEQGGAANVVPLMQLAARLTELVNDEIQAAGGGGMQPDIEDELTADAETEAAMQGPASGFTCPDCHGALWELREGELARFRCRVGHSYSPDTLLAQQSEKIEDALWAGYRALEESAALAKKLADRARDRGSHEVAARYVTRYEIALERARTLRAALEARQPRSVEQDE